LEPRMKLLAKHWGGAKAQSDSSLPQQALQHEYIVARL